MCGIVALLSTNNAPCFHETLSCLEILEYRGYDSSGISSLNSAGNIFCIKSVGTVNDLRHKISQYSEKDYLGTTCLAHTRWATHGGSTETNAHPHSNQEISIVHNGIIDNHLELKSKSNDYPFSSETDTEVALALLTSWTQSDGLTELEAIGRLLSEISGSFASVILFRSTGSLYAVRLKSPMVIGFAKDRIIASSDVLTARSLKSESLVFLDDFEIARIGQSGVEFFSAELDKIDKKRLKVEVSDTSHIVTRAGYETFMIKEIHEQPTCIKTCITNYTDKNNIIFPSAKIDFSQFKNIHIISCGTSFYAGLMAKLWIESLTEIEVSCSLSSEFNCTKKHLSAKQCIYIFISQSGETADTLSSISRVLTQKSPTSETLVIVNSDQNSMIREAKNFVHCLAGPEIGVAATKSFTSQLTTLALLSLKLYQKSATLKSESKSNSLQAFLQNLNDVSGKIQNLLNDELKSEIKAIAHEIASSIKSTTNQTLIFTGKAEFYCLALEASLKTQELSYRPSIPVASGELKHGPMSLLDENAYVVLFTHSEFKKTHKPESTIQEVRARGAKVVIFSDANNVFATDLAGIRHISLGNLGKYDPLSTPLCYIPAIQLLSYYIANELGNNIDRPRGLAKSVTVE